MTPSNQHSDEAKLRELNDEMMVALVGRIRIGMGDTTADSVEQFLATSAYREQQAFDRGRESKQHTDREKLARLLFENDRDNSDAEISWDTVTAENVSHAMVKGWVEDAYRLADAILAVPSLSLVAVRDEVAELLSDFNACGSCAEAPPYCAACGGEADALFASGILKPSSEVEAAALEAAAEEIGAIVTSKSTLRNTVVCVDTAYVTRALSAIRTRAARVRSGKAEA